MRPFAILFTASTASNLGDGVLLAAVSLLARRITDDPLAVSLVTVASTLPWLLFGLAAGAIVDRTDRKQAMVVADLLRFVGLAAFAVLVAGRTPALGTLIAVVFALGVAETVFDTAAQAMLPAVVDADHLERANGRLFGAQVATNGFVGPPLGALLFGIGVAAPLLFDAATFALSAALLARLPAAAKRGRARTGVTTLRADAREGLAWVWRHRGVRSFAIGAAVINLAHTGAMAVVVLLVRDVLDAGDVAFGLALTGAAVGSMAGTQLASAVVRWAGRRRAVLGTIVCFSGSLVVAGAAPHVAVAAVALAAFGAAGEVWNVIAVSYRQAIVPDALLGRVMATYRVIAYGAMPVGAAAGGLIAHVAGVRAAFIVGGAAVALLLVFFGSPRRADMLL